MQALKLHQTTMCSRGQHFGNYQLVRLVGQGGFAAVYLGEHRYLGTQAAVKVLHSWLTNVDVRKFSVEARIAARLIHPHIIRVLDFGLEGEMPYLVMDYASNGTTRQRYPSRSRLASNVIINYVGQIASALQYIHDRGLIHRDIKPENLLLGHNYELLLSDFGITIAAHEATDSREQRRVGTITYMAPEQIQGYPCLASDQYALGIVVYEWLCGDLPFQGSIDDIMQQHLYESPPSLRERVPTIPFAIENVVLRALAKDPQQRFSCVREFAVALKDAFEYRSIIEIGHSHLALKRPTSSQSIRVRENKNKKRNIWQEIFTLFAFDLLIGTVLAIVLYRLGVELQSLWLLFSLCIVLLSLGGALTKRSRLIFLLTFRMVIAAALPGMIANSFMLFVMVLVGLILLSLLTAFTAFVHGF